MSVQFCEDCDKFIDTDVDCEHFEMHQEEIQEDTTSMEEKLEALEHQNKISKTKRGATSVSTRPTADIRLSASTVLSASTKKSTYKTT